MAKLLVTGGAGFIGSNFIRYMYKKYPESFIINLDKLTYCGNLESLRDIEADKDRYIFIKGDICNTELVEFIFKTYKPDYVINFAAESHVDRSILSPQVFITTNISGTLSLLEASKKFGITKFIQVSTDEVYGSLGDTGLFTEETPISPNSPYSASKASADMIVRAYHETYNLPVNITRCSNNYGPYQFPEKLIPLFISNALQDRELPVYGDGKNIRDWLYVEDHNSAIDLVMRKGITGQVYNIGGNNEKTNMEITRIILSCLGKSEALIKYVKDRLGHDRRYAIDSTKIQRELGWTPLYSFDLAIKETIDWYINNKLWWERIKSGEYQKYYESNYMNR